MLMINYKRNKLNKLFNIGIIIEFIIKQIIKLN